MKVRREFFSILLPLVIFGLALAPVAGHPQQTSNQPNDIPPGVSFTVRLKDGKTQFYQGELITIEMLFSSASQFSRDSASTGLSKRNRKHSL